MNLTEFRASPKLVEEARAFLYDNVIGRTILEVLRESHVHHYHVKPVSPEHSGYELGRVHGYDIALNNLMAMATQASPIPESVDTTWSTDPETAVTISGNP